MAISETETTRQEVAGAMVRREVVCCVSGLIDALAKAYGDRLPDSIGDMVEQAFELASPVEDYDEAMRENDWTYDSEEGVWRHDDYEPQDTAQDACDVARIDASDYQREVYEHWMVSNWLAARLLEHGEKVSSVDELPYKVWARTTTGQAILLDGVIVDIAMAAHRAARNGE